MRFTLATAVLSLAAMVIAVPTENGLRARTGQQCNQGQTVHCCNAAGADGGGGLLNNLLDLDLQCANLNVPIVSALIQSQCKGSLACCDTGASSPDCDDDSNNAGAQGINILTNIDLCNFITL
ncbi:hypothetical protein NHQ30_008220 [Ciborinia camelliae]|nr:hypothetical protein NHQ30_008220 [Ciborinia camelliae]